MRGVEMAGHELVADIGPGGFGDELDIEAAPSGKMLMERATSAIFLFSFIATCRMRA